MKKQKAHLRPKPWDASEARSMLFSLRGKVKQTFVAETIGVHPSSYCRLESGQREYSVKDLLGIAEALDLTPNQLLGFDPI